VAVATLPAAASLERTNAVSKQLAKIAREVPGVDGLVYLSGFNLLTGQVASYNATVFIRFKPWDVRKSPRRAGRRHRAHAHRAASTRDQGRQRPGDQPAADPGLFHDGGFTFVLQDRAGAGPRSSTRCCRTRGSKPLKHESDLLVLPRLRQHVLQHLVELRGPAPARSCSTKVKPPVVERPRIGGRLITRTLASLISWLSAR